MGFSIAGEFPPVVPQSPPARVKLTGIAVLPPDKWVSLRVEEFNEPAVEVVLREGWRRLSVRVVEIDSHARWAIIRCGATDVKLIVEGKNTSVVVAAEFGGEHRPLPLLPPPGSGDP